MLKMQLRKNRRWGRGYIVAEFDLLLDLVGAAEHAVNTSEIVGAREEGVNGSLGCEVLLQVSLLTKVAHLIIVLVVFLQKATIISKYLTSS